MKTLMVVVAALFAIPAFGQQRLTTPAQAANAKTFELRPWIISIAPLDISIRPWIHQELAPKFTQRPWIISGSPRYQFDVPTTVYGLTHFSVGGDVVNVGRP